MKWKKLIIYIIILLIIYAIMISINKDSIYSNTPFSKKIDTSKINSIIIKEGNKSIKLDKKTNKWFLTQPYEYKADNIEIENTINKLSQIKLFGPLTDKEKNYQRFEIYPSSSTEVILKAEKIVSFITGKGAQDFGGTFIKFVDGKEIYEAKGIYPFDFKKTYEDFIFKKLMESDEKETTKIDINFQNIKYSDSKTQETWVKNETQKLIDIIKEVIFSKIEKTEPQTPRHYDLEIILTNSSGYEQISFKKSKNYIAYKNGYKFILDEPNSKKIDEIIKIINIK